MTINYDNVYLKEASTVVGLDEMKGPLKDLYDKCYNDYYLGEKTFEQAEMKMLNEAIRLVLSKNKSKLKNIDVVLGADLLNQITVNAYLSANLKRPFLGLYNACASLC